MQSEIYVGSFAGFYGDRRSQTEIARSAVEHSRKYLLQVLRSRRGSVYTDQINFRGHAADAEAW